MTTNVQDLPVMLRVRDVAQILGTSESYVYEMIRRHTFPVVRLSRKFIRIPRDRFFQWLDTVDATEGTSTEPDTAA